MSKIKGYFYALRPYQWIKNGFVFLPLIFGEKLGDPDAVLRTCAAFIFFCAAAGGIYAVNDVLDLTADRQHPLKKLRPLAAGRIAAAPLLALALILLLAATAGSFFLRPLLGLIVVFYIGANLVYSFFLKHIVIVDVMMIGVFFLLRLAAGSVVIPVGMSDWLLICATVLALFLGFNKRRHELRIRGPAAGGHRKVLSKYNVYFIDQMISVLTASTVVFYTLYTVDEGTVAHFGTRRLLWTVPFVYYGIFRYLYLVHKLHQGGDPARIILKDGMLKLDVVLWLAAAIAAIYFPLG